MKMFYSTRYSASMMFAIGLLSGGVLLASDDDASLASHPSPNRTEGKSRSGSRGGASRGRPRAVRRSVRNQAPIIVMPSMGMPGMMADQGMPMQFRDAIHAAEVGSNHAAFDRARLGTFWQRNLQRMDDAIPHIISGVAISATPYILKRLSQWWNKNGSEEEEPSPLKHAQNKLRIEHMKGVGEVLQDGMKIAELSSKLFDSEDPNDKVMRANDKVMLAIVRENVKQAALGYAADLDDLVNKDKNRKFVLKNGAENNAADSQAKSAAPQEQTSHSGTASKLKKPEMSAIAAHGQAEMPPATAH